MISALRLRRVSAQVASPTNGVTQLLRQGDAKVFKKYSQMKLQMKREALLSLDRQASEKRTGSSTEKRSRLSTKKAS